MKTKSKLNKLLKAAGITLLIYGLLECLDVYSNFAAMLGWSQNSYPPFYFDAINKLFTQKPLYSFLFTLIPTSLRLISGIGILRDRMWGFWLAIIVSIYTFCVFTLFLPLGVYDGILTTIVLIFLLIGYCGKSKISSFIS